MQKAVAFIALILLSAVPAGAQVNTNDIVDLELLTHTEVSQKLKDGWTSILLVTGGTEERGPAGRPRRPHDDGAQPCRHDCEEAGENAGGAGTARWPSMPPG